MLRLGLGKYLQLLYTGNNTVRAWNRHGASQHSLGTSIFSARHITLAVGLLIVAVAMATNSQLTVSIPNEQYTTLRVYPPPQDITIIIVFIIVCYAGK